MKTTQRQIVGAIEPSDLPGAGPGHIPGPPMQTGQATNYFATVSGGEISAAVEKIYDGNNAFPDVLCAPSEIGDISVSKFYDEQFDLTFLEQLRQLVGRVYYDVTIFTLDCDLKVSGSERVYPRCLLVGLSDIDGDASSGAPSSFSLTFAVSQITPAEGTAVA
tara:strand:- start:109 stop:597 length:489 start_codon:yes stop_codon:yes gene_type:complete